MMCKLASQRCSGGHMTQQPDNFTMFSYAVQMPYIAHSSVRRDPMSQKQLSYVNPPLCGSHREVRSCLQCMRGAVSLQHRHCSFFCAWSQACSSCTACGHMHFGAISCIIGCWTFCCQQDAKLDLLGCHLYRSETLTAY